MGWLPPVQVPAGYWTHSLGISPDQRSNPPVFWCMGWCFDQLNHSTRAWENLYVPFLGTNWIVDFSHILQKKLSKNQKPAKGLAETAEVNQKTELHGRNIGERITSERAGSLSTHLTFGESLSLGPQLPSSVNEGAKRSKNLSISEMSRLWLELRSLDWQLDIAN